MMRGPLHFTLLFSIALLPGNLAFADTSLTYLNQGRADDAVRALRGSLAKNLKDGVAHQLLCRVYYAQENANPAIKECEAAVSAAPNQSDNYLWLGRAYGMKAAKANPLSAFSLARKVVAAFEQAVQLNPSNVAAMRDLGEYYVAAPGIVGGGVEKAHQLAAKMMPVSATKAHRLLAEIAEKQGDPAKAEAEYKHAVEAERSAESLVDLAQFYQDRKEYDQSTATVQAAMRLDRPRDAAAVDAASILITTNRSLPVAEKLLRDYLESPAQSDAAPVFKVHVQLGDLLLQRGDKDGAAEEYKASISLASGYGPAQHALEGLQRQGTATVTRQSP